MDDTSCTNRHGFPILVILGIDEHKLSQLVAFALIRDRTIEAFVDFLSWVKQYLGADDRDSHSTPVPQAFVVDRHDGQLAALRQVFPESRIVFYAKHLTENIPRALEPESPIITAFWNLIHRKIHEKEFLENLKAQAQHCERDSRQAHMLEFLEVNLQHFSPVQGHDDTFERTSSLIEGFFGALKNVTQHQVLPLATAVRGIRVLGQMALGNRTRAKIPRLPPEIMSFDDQETLGSFAAKTLERESATLEEMDMMAPEMPFPECCDVARIHPLPCVHRMREHDNQIPRIMIREVSSRWQLQELKRDVQV
jgi:hypothetical protein